MLKKIVYSTLVLMALSGCTAYQPMQHGKTVYVERQVIIPSRHTQCQLYIARERNCYNMRYSDTRAICIEDARLHYQNCMHH